MFRTGGACTKGVSSSRILSGLCLIWKAGSGNVRATVAGPQNVGVCQGDIDLNLYVVSLLKVRCLVREEQDEVERNSSRIFRDEYVREGFGCYPS